MSISVRQSRAVVLYLVVLSWTVGSSVLAQSARPEFHLEHDLLLAHYDCKTDVDDLHSVAAFATILANPAFGTLDFHAVAGAYGAQEGLYVPPNELFAAAFGHRWSDAHGEREAALKTVTHRALSVLDAGGNIWVAEAGQSDFTAELVRVVMSARPDLDAKGRIVVVQHSDWNEESATPEMLAFVRSNTGYHKIPDGNATGNGTPGFRSEERTEWETRVTDPRLTELWSLATALANRFNGKDGRYLNAAIAAGGLDFSDTAEIVWILGLAGVDDAEAFLDAFGQASRD